MALVMDHFMRKLNGTNFELEEDGETGDTANCGLTRCSELLLGTQC